MSHDVDHFDHREFEDGDLTLCTCVCSACHSKTQGCICKECECHLATEGNNEPTVTF